ncbi:class I SAM-dependent methyltransferase [Methanospirillum purgamenti]|uniref:Class I SAM-dependent methyltransferase n=1 Tax=Methanospirillum hungatei TaxID=2203 RepID=A0A8F5VKL9_METHU|nr:class I SAM-dependent methyltransferase [Methanospirillum hungatei]QXO94564.1 class I SAM-dependent methyltransferase [Methanospirillum hungatei]
MLFLSDLEKNLWKNYGQNILTNDEFPDKYRTKIRSSLLSAFYYYIGTLLAKSGQYDRTSEWLHAGTLCEEAGLYSSTYLLGFLKRHNGMMIKPAVAFEDPRPFIHFSTVPIMEQARTHLIRFFADSLPEYDKPIRFMDIGCGDGALTVRFLEHLVNSKKIPGLSEILLIDSSPAMISIAEEKVSKAFPDVLIKADHAKIQNFSIYLHQHYDIAMSSLAYHHMPVEDKQVHLSKLKPWIDHFLLFEMDANNDTPDMNSPELALSVYQSYGRIMDFVFSYDAPVEVVISCIDSFLMTELVSLMSEPRGVRTDYHMLRSQWHDLFKKSLGSEFTLRSDCTCYADEYLGLFTLHYGRG